MSLDSILSPSSFVVKCHALNEISSDNSKSYENILIILDDVDNFKRDMENTSSKAASFLKLTARDAKCLKVAAENLKESLDTAASTNCTIFDENSSKTRQFILGVPAKSVSRSNAPSRCHSIGTLAEKLGVSPSDAKDYLIILYSSSISYVYSQLCAIGRQFPIFSMKSSKDKESDASVKYTVDIIATTDSDKTEQVDSNLCNVTSSTIKNIQIAQCLVDCPPNILHSDKYVSLCEELAKSCNEGVIKQNVHCTVIKGEDLDAQGFGGLWGVGKASTHLPALVVLSYYPSDSDDKEQSICMVGKGIIYDTGGLSIKSKDGMCGMKTDMGGSAGMLGAFFNIVETKSVTRPFHCILCIAENSVGPIAARPDDVHTMLSGKTVEINNTDAEGRLVLGDGVFYAADRLNASHIFDMATLTGAQLIATGRNHAALYCNDDDLESLVLTAGKTSGDLTHNLPYCPEFYRKEFASKVADMKNSVADRSNAQSSCAGQFIGNHLETFLKDGGKWCHIDMAGPCNFVGFHKGRATGYGVALLTQAVRQVSKLRGF